MGRPLLGSFLVCAALLALSGCSGSNATVEGVVKLDDVPVEAGHISFIPLEGTAGSGGRAAIMKGRYTLDSASRLAPGAYRVEIYARRKTGKQIPVGSPAPPGTMADEEVEAVPERYNKKSQLRQDLKAGSNPVDFSLTSKDS